MKKREKNKRAMTQLKAYFLIVNLIIAIVAFSWMISAETSLSQLPVVGSLFSGKIVQSGGGFVESYSETAEVKVSQDMFDKISDSVLKEAIKVGDTKAFIHSYNAREFSLSFDNKTLKGAEAAKTANVLGIDISNAVKADMYNSLKNANIKFGGLTKEMINKPIGDTNLILKSYSEKNGQITAKIQGIDGKTSAELTGTKNQLVANQLKVQEGAGRGLMGGISDFFGKNIINNLLFAGTLGGLGALIGSFIGGNGAKAGFFAGFGGAAAYKIAQSAVTPEGKILGLSPGWFGIGVGVGIFLFMFKKTSKEVVTFECNVYEPPRGGIDCEKCQDNKLIGCTEYRCKSLGQACELLNKGTKQEACVWVNPRDVSSPVIEIIDILKSYKWVPDKTVRPPAKGVYISQTNGDDVEAFTALEFVIHTDEPSQCKIDYNLTKKFDDMSYYVGGSNIFSYNHTEKMSLPSPDSINKVEPELKNDGTYTLYIRCADANGNFNQDAYSVRFKVKAGPDTTPPKIEDVSVKSGNPIQFNQTFLDLEVYVNEPAECKWSTEDRSYDNMENTMSCSTNVWEMNNNNVYTCLTTLTGIQDRKENKFYFRCKDNPGADKSERNVNTQSYLYRVIGTQPLNILEVEPNETIKGSTNTIPVELKIKTDNGYNNGKALCYYSLTNDEKDYILFAETDSNEHTQRQNLVTGSYTYYFKCVDLGGNTAYDSTKFSVEVDRTAPVVVRTYKEGDLKIITDEKSVCGYSTKDCNFEIKDGVQMPYDNEKTHTAAWKSQTYYIRCKDEYDKQPDPNRCSIIIKPYNIGENVVEL